MGGDVVVGDEVEELLGVGEAREVALAEEVAESGAEVLEFGIEEVGLTVAEWGDADGLEGGGAVEAVFGGGEFFEDACAADTLEEYVEAVVGGL